MRSFILPGIITIILATAMFLITNDSSEKKVIVKGDLPAIQLLLTDSVNKYNIAETKGKKPVLLFFFNTTCDHCQALASELVEKQRRLKDIEIIMASTEELSLIKKFSNQYSLFEVQNLIVGKDIASMGIRTFHFESYPFCAVYNNQHKLIRSFVREFDFEDVLKVIYR